jgi:cyanophycinase
MPWSYHLRASLLLIAVLVITAWPGWSAAQVLLAGGHLPVCSSMSPDQCRSRVEWPDDALRERKYAITPTAITRWALAMETRLVESDVQHWLRLLAALSEDRVNALSRQQLISHLRTAQVEASDPDQTSPVIIEGERLYQAMSDGDWSTLLDHLQIGQVGRREQVRLDASINESALAVFEHFVAMAAERSDRERPLIAISTASSRDPYDALDFYLQVFAQAGAEVVWLPLDTALRRARAEDNCLALAAYQASELGTYQRQAVWPHYFEQQLAYCLNRNAGPALVEEVDGLFLNGGDQWLTLHAFRDEQGQATMELERILQRLDDNTMVLGGTSAGAAVQSASYMISNGSNAAALLTGAHPSAPPPPGCSRAGNCPPGLGEDSLTFHRPGGLGSLPFAIVDTHFSERQRQIRLSQLLAQTQQRYGLGIDETTALEVSRFGTGTQFKLQVVGAKAAWLIDAGPATLDTLQPLDIRGIELHRLAKGEPLTFDPATGLVAATSVESGATDEVACQILKPDRSFNELFQALTSQQQSSRLCLMVPLDDAQTARVDLHDSGVGNGQTNLHSLLLNIVTLPDRFARSK